MVSRLYYDMSKVFLAVLVFAASLSAMPAKALDLDQAQRDGFLVSEALALGARGDWTGAETLVAAASPIVRDVVLWRKLRSGDGSYDEYRDYIARRGDWPGRSALERAVVGGGGSGQPVLRGEAADNWRAFSRAYRSKRYDDAEARLLEVTWSPEMLGDPKRWAKRRLALARRAAREGRAENAYRMASQHYLTTFDGYDYSDCEWVAGWIALRKLGDPQRAIAHFTRFRESIETPISVGRGGYWLGRAYEAAGDQESARRWYADAAQFQTSFYGQLAAAKIGAPGLKALTQGGLPDWRTHPAMRDDMVHLGAVLHYAGEDRLALATFSSLGASLPAGALAPLSRLVLDLGKTHYAVRVAKKAARRGVLIYPAYYPLHQVGKYATKVEPAFALSIARQETEMNPRAISRAGARGLMQLMPATARKVASWIGEDYSRDRLINDWQYNVRLGETYLSRRTEQFGGSYVMAAAAYNAGAGRVDQWIGDFGDPRRGDIDVIDWMEQIPFNETRNYVQRVMEGLYVYHARLDDFAGPMSIEADLARGFTVQASQ
ncbi:MAG: lytic transglycosylase domain-containing protein [Pseudomonadota bacterium]